MIRLALFITISLLLIGCAEKNPYHIYKPKVRYKPSIKALDKLNRSAMGKRYIWGEERATKGFDCSGLTYYNFGTMGIEIPRVADEQFRSGTPVARSDLQKGDLVFFATNRRKPWKATHVGIYLGNGMFEHASSAKKRVIISSLNSPYYSKHYIGARRYHNFNQCRPKQNRVYYAKREQTTPTPTQSYQELTNSTYTPTNVFSQEQKSLSGNNSKYYIVINSIQEDPYSLVTKLELSGLRADVRDNKVLVGPFNSQSEAAETKYRNRELLSNSDIRVNI